MQKSICVCVCVLMGMSKQDFKIIAFPKHLPRATYCAEQLHMAFHSVLRAILLGR